MLLFLIDSLCFSPVGKFQHDIEISIKTARVSRLSISCNYDSNHVDILYVLIISVSMSVIQKGYLGMFYQPDYGILKSAKVRIFFWLFDFMKAFIL